MQVMGRRRKEICPSSGFLFLLSQDIKYPDLFAAIFSLKTDTEMAPTTSSVFL